MGRRLSEGSIVRIDLDEHSCCYAKLLVSPLVAFFDTRVPRRSAPAPADPGALLFKVWVSKEGWQNKRWPRVGKQTMSTADRQSPVFFKKDKVDGRYYHYIDKCFLLTSRQACLGLERAAVWDPVHVEERLRAHFSGEKSIFAESLKA